MTYLDIPPGMVARVRLFMGKIRVVSKTTSATQMMCDKHSESRESIESIKTCSID